MPVLDRFIQNLKQINYPDKFEGWHVEGILLNKSNQLFKFDVQGMQKVSDNKLERKGSFKSKADKMVFETKDHWIIVDIDELHTYVKTTNNKDINLNTIVNDFEWNIVITK